MVPDRQLQWKKLVQHVTTAFKRACKHAKNTDLDLIELQYHWDQFNVQFCLFTEPMYQQITFIIYPQVIFMSTCINIVHYIYIYSQESWEATNDLIKSFYFRRTQRGGACGKMGKK